MKLCVLVMTMVAAATSKDRFDIKMDEVLINKTLLTSYLNCMVGEGPCTPDGNQLRGYMSEGLGHGCANCTNAQRSIVERVIKHLLYHDLSWWQVLVNKYDPNGVYASSYESTLTR